MTGPAGRDGGSPALAGGTVGVLWRLGYRCGRGAGAGSVTHRLGLFSAAALAVLAGWLLVAANGLFAAREARVVAREPVPAAEGATPVAYWLDHGDVFRDRQFLIVYVSPIRPDAAPPPGLSRWPAPGEAFLSPALAAADVAGVLRQRYGRFAGEIGAAGLAEPDEWLVYHRPPADDAFARYGPMALISGFGGRPGPLTTYRTAGLSSRTYAEMYQLIGFALVLPVLVLLGVAVRGGADQRDRRLAMIDALGAPRRAKGWVLVGEASLPVAAGVALASAAAFVTTVVDLTVPVTGYRSWSSDLAPRRVGIALVALVAVATVLGAVLVTQLRVRREASTRPRLTLTKPRRWPVAVCLLAVGAAVWSATAGAARPGSPKDDLLSNVFLVALVVSLVTTPIVMAGAASGIGRICGRIGRGTGWVGALVGGRWLAQRSAGLARVCAAMVVGLGILMIVQVWVSQHSRAGDWSHVRKEVQDQLITIRTSVPDAASDRFVAAVGADRVLWVGENADGRQVLVGTCSAARFIGELAGCPATATPATSAYRSLNTVGRAIRYGSATVLVYGEPTVSPVKVDGYRQVGFLVFNPDGPPGAESITRAAFAFLAIPDITGPGQYGISGMVAMAQTYRWLWLFGMIGASILVFSTVLGAVDVFLTQARGLGPLGTFRAGRPLYLWITLWNVTLPLAVTGVVGAALASLLGKLHTRLNGAGSLSWQVLGQGSVVIAGVLVILTLFCTETAVRTVRRWHPVAD